MIFFEIRFRYLGSTLSGRTPLWARSHIGGRSFKQGMAQLSSYNPIGNLPQFFRFEPRKKTQAQVFTRHEDPNNGLFLINHKPARNNSGGEILKAIECLVFTQR